jgi:hypothetical protein
MVFLEKPFIVYNSSPLLSDVDGPFRQQHCLREGQGMQRCVALWSLKGIGRPKRCPLAPSRVMIFMDIWVLASFAINVGVA